MLKRYRRAALLAICAGLFVVSDVAAASIRVSPITLDLAAGRHAGALTLTNRDDHPVVVQVRVLRWTQVDGADRLSPTDDVVASPPLTTLAAGADQLVRIVRVRPGPAAGEETYRVLVDEIPDPGVQRPGEVVLTMRQSLPVFFNDGPAVQPALTWSLEPGPSGERLVARNAGGRRLRISEVALSDSAGTVVYRLPGLAGYVLAGSSHAWPLPAADVARAVALTATSDLGPVQADLAPARAQ